MLGIHPRLLVAVGYQDGTVAIEQLHPESGDLERVCSCETTGTGVVSFCWSTDASRLRVADRDGHHRILDATTLREAPPPSCGWAEPRTASADGRWKAELQDGQLCVLPARSE
jgi:WD40 repeat protein